MTETINLHDVQGFTLKNGVDGSGNHWIEFETDYFAEEPGQCSICGRVIESGWLCLDGGEEVCSEHIEYEVQ